MNESLGTTQRPDCSSGSLVIAEPLNNRFCFVLDSHSSARYTDHWHVGAAIYATREHPMDIIPDKRRVVSLVEQAAEGKLCLPDFQRDFVWRRGEIADLLRSILRRYFIGSLLLLRCDPQKPPFAPEFLRGARSAFKDPRPEFLVLDGQQRLTSLLYVLTAPDLPLRDSTQRRWFFLDLNLLLTDPDDDAIVFDRTQKELDSLDQPAVQYARRILPSK
jgi:Protein of unknown function DUF262